MSDALHAHRGHWVRVHKIRQQDELEDCLIAVGWLLTSLLRWASVILLALAVSFGWTTNPPPPPDPPLVFGH